MRARSSVAILAPLAADAFAPASHATATRPSPLRAGSDDGDVAAAAPLGPPSLVGVPHGADAILSTRVTSSAGEVVRIEDAIRSSGAEDGAPHVVVYFRHLG